MKRIAGYRFTVLPVILTALAVTAMAAVVTFFPSDIDPGVPAYARIELVDGKTPLVHHDKEWAAIAFYRDPACVPAGFNLLEFLDIPRVFECSIPMTVSGFSIWKNAPAPVDPSPIHTESHGEGAVPVWFVRWDSPLGSHGPLKPELSDNVLTMADIVRLVPLKGSASFFKETLNPLPGATRTITQIVARGTLEDGRTFDLQSVENSRSELNDIESNTVTTIRFK